ncbi:hypothetical protein [Pectobacterium aroidearum]|uniref:hypothetical protein n=1 Tax=Pectobacterium aroidearum TaxID=1201031 RepID=UPI0032EBF83F
MRKNTPNKRSAFFAYLDAKGIQWKRNGKTTAVFGSLHLHQHQGNRFKVPTNLCVHGDVHFAEYSKIPKNIEVTGSLYIHGSPLCRYNSKITIPASLKVGSNVYLYHYNGRWPINISAINGHFFWIYSDIKSLPEIFVVKGVMDVTGSILRTPPSDLTVGGDLKMLGTRATHLPERMILGGILNLAFSNIPYFQAGPVKSNND